MEIKNIGVHHFAGELTLTELNEAHRIRWPDFPSRLRPDLFVGYNFVVWKDGSYLQARYIGEETAAQVGHNTDTVSICLAGDFSIGVDSPTEAQQNTLKWLIQVIQAGKAERNGLAVKAGTVVNIAPQNVYPHRVLQPHHTECYGSSLSDTWARDLAFPPVAPPRVSDAPVTPPVVSEGVEISRLSQIVQILLKLIGLQKLLNQSKLGGMNHCWDAARG